MAKNRAYLAWVVLCLVWGTTYLAIRVALESIPPLLMAGARWIVAGTLLIGFFWIRGERLPDKHQWWSLAVRGVLLIGLGNGAVVWAEQTLPSGLTAVLVAVTPFWMVGIDALLGDGKAPTARRVVGLLIGFLGIVLLVSPDTRTGCRGPRVLERVHRDAAGVRRVVHWIHLRASARPTAKRYAHARHCRVRDALRRGDPARLWAGAG